MKKYYKKINLAEDIEFELELVDDLLKEINARNINEGFMDSLKGFFGGFGKKIEGGLKELFGLASSSYSSSSSVAAEALGVEPGKTLDPDNDPKDLVIWGSSQDYVLEGLEKIQSLIGSLNTLPGPVPNPDKPEEMEKWESGGQYAVISEDIAAAAGVAQGTAMAIADDSIGKIKNFKQIAAEIDSLGKDETIMGLLQGIIVLCENIQSGPWEIAMNKASEINKSDFSDKGLTIDPNPAFSLADSIKQIAVQELGRLDGLMKQIELKAGKEEEPEAPKTGAF